MNQLKERLQSEFNLEFVSAQVVPINTYDEKGEAVTVQALVVLDADNKFMFFIGPEFASQYMIKEYEIGGTDIDYQKIFKDFILTEEQYLKVNWDEPIDL